MNKYIFAITGPTGAGKSTVSNKFRELGVLVVDADLVAREVLKVGSECLNEIKNTFGNGILLTDGSLNRTKLAGIVFNDKNKLDLLNNITHKYIREHIERQINSSDCKIAAIDGAVIIGSPVADLIRKFVVVSADENVRLKRIMKRDNISYDSAASRMRSQMSLEDYLEYADFIIENNDDKVGLGECIEQIFGKIKDFSQTENAKTPKTQKA